MPSLFDSMGNRYEMVGEDIRGGNHPLNPNQLVGAAPGLAEIVGALLQNPMALNHTALAQSPGLQNALAARIARAQPVLERVAPTAWRKWQTGIGPVTISAAGTATVTITPQCLFRVEKMYLNDSSANGTGASGGYASYVTGVTIGQLNQMPNNTKIPVWVFGPGLLGNGIEWDTCQGAYSMTLTFYSDIAATISGGLFGQSVKNS